MVIVHPKKSKYNSPSWESPQGTGKESEVILFLKKISGIGSGCNLCYFCYFSTYVMYQHVCVSWETSAQKSQKTSAFTCTLVSLLWVSSWFGFHSGWRLHGTWSRTHFSVFKNWTWCLDVDNIQYSNNFNNLITVKMMHIVIASHIILFLYKTLHY